MSGFDHTTGRSNNMVAAESAGKMTIGRWAKRHGVSARAAVEVMAPTEAHHTGTGRRGKSRLTPVIGADIEPTETQLGAMRGWDAGSRPDVRGWYARWVARYDNPYGRRRNVALVATFEGSPAKAPRKLYQLDDSEFARAKEFEGRRLKAYATTFADVREED